MLKKCAPRKRTFRPLLLLFLILYGKNFWTSNTEVYFWIDWEMQAIQSNLCPALEINECEVYKIGASADFHLRLEVRARDEEKTLKPIGFGGLTRKGGYESMEKSHNLPNV